MRLDNLARWKARAGFVRNEPLSVFSIVCAICLILAGLIPVAWYWRILIGLGTAAALAISFIAYASLSADKSERAPNGNQHTRRRALFSVAILFGITAFWLCFKLHREYELRWPLLNAVQNGDVSRVRELLNRGADPNDAVFHRLEALPPVLNDDRRPGAGVPQNETPLVVAVVHGRVEIVRLLLDRGANPNTWCAYDSEGGVAGGQRSPLEYAESAKRIQEGGRSSDGLSDSINIIDMLKRAGAK